jgi:outer membrane biosynthesis protein TonB
MSESEQEKKNKRIATFTTVGVNVVVLLILLFIVAWRAPNPPLPEFGIELNFGMDTQGSGDVQPREPVGSPQAQEEVQEQQAQPEESQPDPAEEQQQTETAAPAEVKPAEEQVTSKIESPVAVKEEKKEESKPVEKPVEQKPVPKPVEKKPEPKVVEKPKVDPNATYNPNKAKTADATSDKAGQPGSQGDDKSKTGDKGSPEGNPEAKALYGKPGGGGGGPSLDLAGWSWDTKPAPSVPDNELGGIVKFEVKVDDKGDIVSIKTVERSVSAETEQACKQSIQRLTFTKTGDKVPPISTGTITFVVRSK